jgi:hypothetical protein
MRIVDLIISTASESLMAEKMIPRKYFSRKNYFFHPLPAVKSVKRRRQDSRPLFFTPHFDTFAKSIIPLLSVKAE